MSSKNLKRARLYRLRKTTSRLDALIRVYENENEKNREAARDKEYADRKIELFTLLFVILTTIGVFFQGYIAYKSDQAMHEAAEASRVSADAAVAANRAWVAPIGAKLTEPLDINNPVAAVNVTVENTGKEPAIDVAYLTTIEAEVLDKIQEFTHVCADLKPIRGQTTLYPSNKFQVNINNAVKFVNKPNAIADILNGKQVLVVKGCVAYNTAGKPRSTSFCFFLYPELGPETGVLRNKAPSEWTFRGCPIGNYAD